MAASNLSENDVLIILGIGAFILLTRKKTATVKVASATGSQPSAQASAANSIFSSLGSALSGVIGTAGAVAAANIVTNGLGVPSPGGNSTQALTDLSSSTDGAVLNPPGMMSATDYVDSENDTQPW